MTSELHQIKRIFDGFQMALSMEWLESCIEWCKQDNLPENYTIKHLQNLIYEQWLLLDLRDVEIPSLPANLNSEKKYVLTGVYYLQVLQVIDISKPKLWQIQRIRNKVSKNAEVERDFGKRVLQLTLTDGVQEVQAMEFKAVACLSINSPPGTKLKIIGPVLVRNGRIMLESENVKNLGGSVDDLMVSNAAENVLARALGLQENPTPNTIDEKILDVSEGNNPTETHRQEFSGLNENRLHNQSNMNATIARNARTNSVANQRNMKPTNSKNLTKIEVDDELLRELQEDFDTSMVDIKSSVSSSTLINSKANFHCLDSNRGCLSPDLFEEIEFDDVLLNKHLNEIDIPSTSSKPRVLSSNLHSVKVRQITETNQRKVSKIEGSKTNSTARNQKVEDIVIVLDDSFDDIDIDSHLDLLDEKIANLPCSTQRRTDLDKHIHSPELKRPRKDSLTTNKKLLQSKLEFGLSTAKSSFQIKNSNLNDMNNSGSPFQNREPFISPKLTSGPFKNTPSAQSLSRDTDSSISNEPPKLNIISIKKLNSLLPNVSKGKFKIRGKFKLVKEKLRTTASSLYLAIIVEDDSGEVTVEVHSSIATKFAQISLERLEQLRQLSLQSDERAKPEIMQALKNLHRKLVALDNILELQVTRGEQYPVVINVIEHSGKICSILNI